MKTTGIFTVHTFKIDCKVGDVINLVPFGDVHRNAPLHALEHWQKFLKNAKDNNEKNYYLGMGDYDDLMSSSERQSFVNGNFHESTQETFEQYVDGKIKDLCEEISFMKGRLIGLLGGNHYYQFRSGSTSDNKMCDIMGCKYLGVSSFIRLLITVGSGNHKCSVDIFAHHGKGNSRLPGGSFNTVEQMRERAEAHIYLMGHDHRKGCIPAGSKLFLYHQNKLSYKKQWLVRTGSFLYGYKDESSSYIAETSMNPADLGVCRLELTPKRITTDGDDCMEVDIHGWA